MVTVRRRDVLSAWRATTGESPQLTFQRNNTSNSLITLPGNIYSVFYLDDMFPFLLLSYALIIIIANPRG